MSTRATLLTSMMAVLCLALPAWGSTIDWALYDAACSAGTSAIEIPCGDYGVFHFIDIQVPSGCTLIAQGSEDPPPYGSPGGMHNFPVSPRMLEGGIVIHPLGTVTLGSAAKAGTAHGTWIPGMPQNPPVNPGSTEPWLAVIDFDTAHGASTTWLVDEVAGPDVDAYLTVLDDPALDMLGEVGDFHVLAKLCAIAEKVDEEVVDPPRVVNMSFGRNTSSGDANGHATCNPHRGSCQIARVIEHLRVQGTRFVAAAGNHQELLFPAALPNVLAAGMLDVTAFFKNVTSPAWETPGAAHAWIPGNALCLDDWAAPAGSSYSSAMLAGWLSEVIGHSPNVDVLAGPALAPRWHPTLACFVLAFGQRLTPWCNDLIDTLFEGLAGASAGVCWQLTTTPSVELTAPPSAQDPTSLPSASAWTNETHPAPESDPCVPCVGNLVPSAGSTDLVIDLSQSAALPSGLYLDSVLVRTGSAFYALPLTTIELQAIQDGTLAQVILTGWGSLFATTQQPSLVYRLKTLAAGDCTVPGTCFWSSTPILLKS